MARGDRDVNLVIRAKNEASRALDTISGALDELRGAQRRVEDGSQQTGNRLQQLGTALSALRKQTRGASALDHLATSADKANASIRKLEESTATTGAEQQRLAAEIAKTERTVDRLSARQAELTAEQQRQAQSARDHKANLAAVTQEIRRAGAATPELTQAQERSRASLERASAAQERARTALGYVNRAYRDTSKQLDGLTRAYDKNLASLSQQERALASARQELGQMEATSAEADASMQKLGASVRRELLASLQRSQNELRGYEQSWNEATAAIAKAVQQGERLDSPSAGLRQQLETAERSKVAYQEMAIAVQRMRTAVREAGTDVTALSGAQQTFISQLDGVEKKISEVTAAQNEQRASADQVANQTGRQANAHQRAARSMDTQSRATRQAGARLEQYNRRAREALSWTQRLNGEIVALATSYVGLFAAIEQARGVVDTFQRIEAAQNKMMVAFEGNDAVAAREMRFIREQAERLGVQFDLLAGQYANLATATRGTNIAGEQTRTIFLQIAEAARVQRLSADQLQGVFKAIEQMASRGTISMEELREQLGDRLPGAFRLATEAMGVTAAELTKMIENGELAAEVFLPRFAQRLSEVTKSELPAALQSFSAELGAFQNEIVKAQETVANAGFIEGMKDALDELTVFFQSSEGQRFFETLGAAAGNLVRFLAAIPQHLQEITFVLSLLIGMKAVSVVGNLGDRFRRLSASLRPMPETMSNTAQATRRYNAAGQLLNRTTATTVPLAARLRNSVRGMSAAMTTAAGRAAALQASVRGLRVAFGALGGVPGLLITGLSFAFSAWLGHTDDVVETTGQHERQMQRLIDEYSRVKDAAGDWGDAVEEGIGDLTLDQARQNLLNQIDAMGSAAETEFRALGRRLQRQLNLVQAGPGGGMRDLDGYGRRILDLANEMREGQITARDYQESLAEMLEDTDLPERYRDWITESADLRQEFVEAQERALEAGTAYRELGGDLEELPPILRELVPSMADLAEEAGLLSDSTPADPMIELNQQMDLLRQKTPSLRSELRLMEELSSIDEILDTAAAIEGIDKTSEAYQQFVDLANRTKAELQDAFDAKRFGDARSAFAEPGQSSVDLSAQLIRDREGYRETPYWDVNALRAGFGSDTVTLSDGTVKAVTEGMRVSVADANRDLVRRISEFQNIVRGQVGEAAWQGLNQQQQAVLTSNAYNYGSLEPALVAAVRAGSTEGIVQALRNQATDNGGINAERRQQEAFLFGNAGQINAEATSGFVEEQLRAAEQQAERAAEYNEQLDRTLARRAEDLQYVDGITREMAIQRAVEDERLAAQRSGVQLTQAQLDLVRQNAATAWDQEAAERAIERSKERQSEMEDRINTLQSIRGDLMEQIRVQQEAGNQNAVADLQVRLTDVNQKLQEALDTTIAWAEGQGLTQMVERLKLLRLEIGQVNRGFQLTWQTAGQAFGSNLLSGMNDFLSRIRETGDVVGSLRQAFLQFASDFLLQIAQMIAQQAIFNALQAASGAFGGGGFFASAAAAVGTNHTGGIAGSGPAKTVSPAWFANAVRYHSGGIAGLKANEVPAILERGEEVLTRNDPRHRANGGGQQAPIKVVNTLDPNEVVEASLATSTGEKVFMNVISRNRDKIKRTLG